MASQGIPLIGPMLNKFFGTRNERFVKRYTSRVEAIAEREEQVRKLTDTQIRGMLAKFREQHAKGATAEDLMIEAFAVAREGMDRSVGIRQIFNPEQQFDPGVLPESVRRLYEETKKKMEAESPRLPRTLMLSGPGQNRPDGVPDLDDQFLGDTRVIYGWQHVDIPIEIYAAVRELHPVSRPPYRSRPFDVQLIGGMVLASGKIAEMKTGEGKTIVGPLAAYLAACTRTKVHVVTVNDYLVQRDRDWTFPFFYALGMTAGAIHPSHTQPEPIKRHMYRCDVVYGTTSEFGFDYLRDNMKRSADEQVQRRRDFAIVDEVDSILIDEARTPLIISGPAHDRKPRYDLADQLARHLVEAQRPWQTAEKKVQSCIERIKGLEGDIRTSRDKSLAQEHQKQLEIAKRELPDLERERDAHTQYYESNEDRKTTHLTHDGTALAQKKAGVGSFYVDGNTDIPHLLEQSLRAYTVYQRDRDYIVMPLPDNQTGRTVPSIVIVDTNTGRPMVGRQWSDGLHQAIEAKERVPIKDETQTVATITIQNFFKMYKRLAGMTGTADTEAQEFHDIYKLDVVSIPTNKAVARTDFADVVFVRSKDKWESIVDEIKAFHDLGRPILVGTTSVENSEMLSQMLTRKHGVKHEVLNAKQHDRESQIIADAGQLGAVMIATNMAGRGTDIKLGSFTREQLLDHWLRRSIAPRTVTTDMTDDQLRVEVYRKVAQADLNMRKREAEEADPVELERRLLEHWAGQVLLQYSENAISQMGTDELRATITNSGKLLVQEVRWFKNVEDLGGLHVIGTERHEARRIDNQLRGRSGRQGDKGSSRFYVALEDPLMQMFGGQMMMKILPRLGLKEGDAIESPMLSKRIEGAQRKVEERNFAWRKNILEYDEIMEHQRQYFYGTRQRVLEGRDVRGLIFDFVRVSVRDAVEEYLDPSYPAECAAEYAKQQLDCSIVPDRLKGKDDREMDAAIRREANEDARHSILLTLGEYVPVEGSEVAVDFDSAGLILWAKNRFGVDIEAADLREGGAEERANVYDMLCAAAEKRIEEADLSGLAEFTQPNFGARKLSEWVEKKFGAKIAPGKLELAQKSEEQTPEGLIMEKAREIADRREIEFPVDFAMDMTMAAMRQNPTVAAQQLCEWAKRRYKIDLTPDELTRTPPQAIRDRLLQGSKRFVNNGHLQKEIDEAVAIADDDALDAYLTERFGRGITDRMRFLEKDERAEAVAARVESLCREELLHLERMILLETLDSTWREHLYEMDQLRDSISFRAISQQDPRIAFKREGARIFKDMLATVRGRVTDQIFRARFATNAQPAQRGPSPFDQPRSPAPAGAQAGAPIGAAAAPAMAAMGGNISGPGLDLPDQPQPEPAPKTEDQEESEAPQSRDDQIAAAREAKEQATGKRRTR